MATQTERRSATTKALRRAARKLFGRRGFDSVSIDDVADAAGVTRGALYHYYASKEQLFEAVFEEVELALVERVLRATLAETDPLEQLRAGCEEFIDATADRQISRIALIDAPLVLGWARYREVDERNFLTLVRQAVDAIRGTKQPNENAMLSRALFGALCELALRAATNPDERDAAKRAARILADAAATGA